MDIDIDKVLEEISIASINVGKLKLEQMWLRAKARRLQKPTAPFGRCVGKKLQEILTKEEIVELSRQASHSRVTFMEIKWPTLPWRLTEKIEFLKDQNNLMMWEVQIHRAMFAAYYKMDYNLTDLQVYGLLPPITGMNRQYTGPEQSAIMNYGCKTAHAYLELVPRAPRGLRNRFTPEERRQVEEWRFMVYERYTRKPEPVVIL